MRKEVNPKERLGNALDVQEKKQLWVYTKWHIKIMNSEMMGRFMSSNKKQALFRPSYFQGGIRGYKNKFAEGSVGVNQRSDLM